MRVFLEMVRHVVVDQSLKVYTCVPICPYDDVGTYAAFERDVTARERKRTIAAVVMSGHTNLPVCPGQDESGPGRSLRRGNGRQPDCEAECGESNHCEPTRELEGRSPSPCSRRLTLAVSGACSPSLGIRSFSAQ